MPVVSPAKFLTPLAILAALGGTAWYLSTRTPPVEQVPHRPTLIPVTASVLAPQEYTVVVPTYGEVRARTESSLIPEVSGMIQEISPAFREGSFFEAGEDPLNPASDTGQPITETFTGRRVRVSP